MTRSDLPQERAKKKRGYFIIGVLLFVVLVGAVLASAKHYHLFGSSKSYIACKLPGEREIIPLPTGVLPAIQKWYAKLGPVVTIAPQGITKLNIEAESMVAHLCHFSDGRTVIYQGKVPVGAIDAVSLEVVHGPYPQTRNVTNILTIVKMANMQWKIVSEDTGP